MGIYSDFIFPTIYDVIARHEKFDSKRLEVLADVRGKVLEIGIGTGRNLGFYPKYINEISAIDPNPGMKRQIEKLNHKIKIDFHLSGAEEIPFKDSSIDTVVSTLTFCSIPQLSRALSEIKRVLRPDGQLIFLEHGLSNDAKIATWQRRLDPIQNVVACGCSLSVNITEHIKTAGFNIKSLKNYYIEKAPKFIGCVYQGVATK